MADLPTNYLDDILAVSMGGKRKFKITHANGSTEEVTIEDISEYAQIGSTFGAGDINKTNQAVNEKFDSGDVVDPMLTTEEGFAADAYKTKLQFDEQNKNINSNTTSINDLNSKINVIECGSRSSSNTNGAATTVNFSNTHPTAPKAVIITPYAGEVSAWALTAKIVSVSATGFSYVTTYCGQSGSGNWLNGFGGEGVQWIAIW